MKRGTIFYWELFEAEDGAGREEARERVLEEGKKVLVMGPTGRLGA